MQTESPSVGRVVGRAALEDRELSWLGAPVFLVDGVMGESSAIERRYVLRLAGLQPARDGGRHVTESGGRGDSEIASPETGHLQSGCGDFPQASCTAP